MNQHSQPDPHQGGSLDFLNQMTPDQIRALAELCEAEGGVHVMAAPLRALADALAAERTGSTSSC